MKSHLRIVVTALAILGAIGIVAVPGGAARADDSGIELSAEGTTWSTAIGASLFSDFGLIVPGDTRATELWVRNATSEPALLRISGRDAAASTRVFGDSLSLAAASDGDAFSAAHTLSSIGSCLQLLPDALLAAGESRKISFQVAFADVGGTLAATNTATLDVRASLMDPGAVDLAPTACPAGVTIPVLPPAPDPPTPAPGTPGSTGDDAGVVGTISDYLPKGVLAFTGASIYSSIMFASLALASGFVLIAAARRRHRRET